MSQQLGLGHSPESIAFIFIGESEDDQGSTPWYMWNHDTNTAIPIHLDALTGYINNISVVLKTYKDKPNYKIRFHITADREYIIQVGAGTVFARGLVLALAHLGNTRLDDLQSPLTITVKQGDDSKAVFAGVFDQHGQKVMAKWDGEISLFPLINKLQEDLGMPVQTKEMIDDPDLYKQALKEARTYDR